MKENPLLKLERFGQSVWLDFIRRGMITSGELAELIREDGLRGVTSNPSIFEKAVGGSHDYDQTIRALALEGKNAHQIYESFTVEDIQRAADLFIHVYDEVGGTNGFVSLEVSPYLAHDTAGTVAEARRFWAAVQRPNLLIKVPATQEGLPAIQQLISEGINVNVTLLFGLERYREVAEAYIAGLEARAAQDGPLKLVASVASFFVSRIDLLVDSLLEQLIHRAGAKSEMEAALRGKVAVASAKVAYQMYQELFFSNRFRSLALRGAHPQRLLWASTSTKNPSYSDVKYVEALIGPGTINTVSLQTLNAYRDHGHPASRLEKGMTEARQVLDRLAEIGINLEEVAQQLEDDGIEKFVLAFDRLMDTLEKKRAETFREPVDRQTLHNRQSF